MLILGSITISNDTFRNANLNYTKKVIRNIQTYNIN
jgi:hypothetical protein